MINSAINVYQPWNWCIDGDENIKKIFKPKYALEDNAINMLKPYDEFLRYKDDRIRILRNQYEICFCFNVNPLTRYCQKCFFGVKKMDYDPGFCFDLPENLNWFEDVEKRGDVYFIRDERRSAILMQYKCQIEEGIIKTFKGQFENDNEKKIICYQHIYWDDAFSYIFLKKRK